MAVTSNRRTRRATARRVAAVGALVLAAALTACTSATPGPTDPTSTSTADGTATPVPTETGPTPATPSPPPASTYSGPPPATAPVVGTTTLPPVPTGRPAAFGDGLVATVTGIRSTEASGTEPGDVAGPAAAVTIRVDNGTDAPVDLGGLTVTAAYGADSEPATALDGAPSAPAQGVLAPGASADGVWAFRVPSADASSLVITITSISSASVVVVRS